MKKTRLNASFSLYSKERAKDTLAKCNEEVGAQGKNSASSNETARKPGRDTQGKYANITYFLWGNSLWEKANWNWKITENKTQIIEETKWNIHEIEEGDFQFCNERGLAPSEGVLITVLYQYYQK